MARILYTINGDGLGHVTRSIPIIRHLIKSKKHEVLVVVGSIRSYNMIKKYDIDAKHYDGLKLFYKDNKLRIFKTTIYNSKIILFGKSFKTIRKIMDEYKPDVHLTDCDHISTKIASKLNIPTVCICNIHAMSELKLNVPFKDRLNLAITNIPVKLFSKKISHHMITTFFRHPARHKNVELFQPILRDKILHAKPRYSNYFLVYQTSDTNTGLIEVLKKSSYRFIVYGFDKDKKEKNITFRKINEDKFFSEFINCKACITNGGHTFITEALALKKPILSIPVRNQYEQQFNAMEIERLGYGLKCDNITTKCLDLFISNLGKYSSRLKKLKRSDNTEILRKIDKLLEQY